MKAHVDNIKQANETITAADAKVARCITEREKYLVAHEAAGQAAEALQEKAARAAALAAVGEGDEAAARKLEADSIAAVARVASIALTLRGFSDAERDGAAAAAAARVQRADAVRAALWTYGATVAAEYVKAARPFIEAARRVHAVQRLLSMQGEKRPAILERARFARNGRARRQCTFRRCAALRGSRPVFLQRAVRVVCAGSSGNGGGVRHRGRCADQGRRRSLTTAGTGA